MNRLPHLFLACCISVFLASDSYGRSKVAAATVILIEGDTTYFENGHRHKIDLGQTLGPNSKIATSKDGGLHLILANGSSLVLGPESELELNALELPPAKPHYQGTLTRGVLSAMVDEEDQPLGLELSTPAATVDFKKAHFELAYAQNTSQVTVDRGQVTLGVKDKDRQELVGSLRVASLSNDRLNRANRLSKREAGAFRQRWARSEMVHQQRKELLKHLKSLN